MGVYPHVLSRLFMQTTLFLDKAALSLSELFKYLMRATMQLSLRIIYSLSTSFFPYRHCYARLLCDLDVSGSSLQKIKGLLCDDGAAFNFYLEYNIAGVALCFLYSSRRLHVYYIVFFFVRVYTNC